MDWTWAVGGVSAEVPRTTGPECVNYMTNRRRLTESFLVGIICLLSIQLTIKKLKPLNLPCYLRSNQELPPPLGRRLLLVAMTFIFGLEMGFKLSTRSVIFILNPCHITTMIQIYLLAAKPTRTTTALFRIQNNYLNGPLLAFVFPEHDSRTLPLEQFTYWVQHALLFIIPIYLIREGGAYKLENIMDFKWNLIGIAIMLLYHFCFLSPISMLTGVNLNHMLCAALADPFQGPNYRIAAIIHQSLLCPILCKLITIIFTNKKQIQLDVKIRQNNHEMIYNSEHSNSNNYNNSQNNTSNNIENLLGSQTTIIEEPIPTTKID
ncbi:transmembrane protein 164 [Condylostylus longicornis]|uniref:transmembrane protein 164 n=1 Tax=Condylostylus longicornis TaxID=2530218 RepID=UPI00244E23BF|nr:transmembrane protein 164 [Condylostylus longicornis]XP_055372523.1 transmembrane protein 164 [Condylostylus longicornis]XP_055372524.1 transmembrane protein 164 [Condylostylus longicornis]